MMATGHHADEDLKQIQELEHARLVARQKHAQMASQLMTLRKTQKRAELTQVELAPIIAEDTKMEPAKVYLAVGRMFLRTDLNEISADLNSQINDAISTIPKLEGEVQYLEREMKNAEEALAEVVNQRSAARTAA